MTAQAITSTPTEGLHLQFILDRSLPVLLPAPCVVEILTVSVSQIVPIFQLPPWVMGVYNWRGEVLWMADLNHLLGLTPWYEQEDYGSQHTVIVLRETSQSKERAIVGLTVNQVQEVVQCTEDGLHSLPAAEMSNVLAEGLGNAQVADLQRFLCGFWQLDEDSPQYWLLNNSAIFQRLSELSSF